jgi:cytochrome P450
MAGFFLAMALAPQAVKAAQEEIDRVIGMERLPSFGDRPKLPYIEALVWEVLRFTSVVPTSVPHRLIQDDIHEGYFIPKVSMLLAMIT